MSLVRFSHVVFTAQKSMLVPITMSPPGIFLLKLAWVAHIELDSELEMIRHSCGRQTHDVNRPVQTECNTMSHDHY